MTRLFATILYLSAFSLSSAAAPARLTADTINLADLSLRTDASKGLDPLTVKAQVLLDRARFSPGEIDGKIGENLKKAIRAFAAAQGLPSDGSLTSEVWSKLVTISAEPVVVEYQITAGDVKGPFLAKLPRKMEDMRDLPALAYTTPIEALAERFHMSEELLRSLNTGKSFDRVGESLVVVNVNYKGAAPKVSRIEVDKAAHTVRAFDRSNRLVAFYPATVGSEEKPSPAGTLKVTGVQKNPTYRYDPEYAFKGVRSKKPFTIKPGPNNPVGTVWIGLSEKGYGIHGSPDPSKVSKTESHGCIRLTNWDVQQLAGMVSKGTPVVFLDEAPVAGPAPGTAPETIGSAGRKRSRSR